MNGDQRVAELLRSFSEQTTPLVRQELELARLELTEKGKRAGLGAGRRTRSLASPADGRAPSDRRRSDAGHERGG